MITIRIPVVAATVVTVGSATAEVREGINGLQSILGNIDATQTAEPVSKYEFGMFIEHIGPLITAAFGLRCLTTANSIPYYISRVYAPRGAAERSYAMQLGNGIPSGPTQPWS